MGNSVPGMPASGGGVYLLDTGILIRSARGDALITARINAASLTYVCPTVLGELYAGAFVLQLVRLRRLQKSS